MRFAGPFGTVQSNLCYAKNGEGTAFLITGPAYNIAMNWLSYHIGEEVFISLVCLGIFWRVFSVSQEHASVTSNDSEIRGRTFLISAGFLLLGISSLLHAVIHEAGLDLNLLYQTLLGYCFGLFILIIAITSEMPWKKRALPLLYLPLIALLIPDVYHKFPIFAEFRPVVWIAISYFSGIVSILYIALYYHTRLRRYTFSALGHLLICISAIFLFFPSGIGSTPWIHGHLMRPIGFGILFFSMNRDELLNIRESLLYKTLAAFCLLAAIPLLLFGMILFYDQIHPIKIESRRIAIFILMLVTLASSLFFGLGMIIRLIRPVIQLKDNVNEIAEAGLEKGIELKRGDEIGELSGAFNEMLARLNGSLSERDRLIRMAATGELAATLAHEIKNPLNSISGAALYIGKNFKGKLLGEFVQIISEEVARLNKLSTNLLVFAKPLPLFCSSCDINRLIKETLSFLELEYDEQDLKVSFEPEEGLPEISIDYDQIRQVLLNLLLNAFDVLDCRGSVTVSTRSVNGYVTISVRDSGKGIKEDDISRIFNPFFTTKTRGTGLGLAISKKIVKVHGGDLTVKSVPGEGSEFTVLLPKR